MEETPVRILGIAPYEGMKLTMEQAAMAYPNIQLDVAVGDQEQGAALVRDAQPDNYDCIISRGCTAECIRRVTDVPVVEVHLSVYDILHTLKLAENYKKRCAIVGFPSITRTAHIVCDLLRTTMDVCTIHSTEETRTALERLRLDGCHMVAGDMMTYTVARELGMDALLITSGIETLQNAIEQAVSLSAGFRRLRWENQFLRLAAREENGQLVVMNPQGEVSFCAPTAPDQVLLALLRKKITELPDRGVQRFQYCDRGNLYSISAQAVSIGSARYCLFYCQLAKIPLRPGRMGVRSYSRDECAYLFQSSFYAISGAMGSLAPVVASMSITRQPVMILGEEGTGREQIARYLYLHNSLSSHPMTVIDCALANDRTWDFLLNHSSSPLSGRVGTLYFQNLPKIPEERITELLATILDTGLQRRQRLIFSCATTDQETPKVVRTFLVRLGCGVLKLPTLRSRADEIPSLASLYLGSLNQQLGKQISGFEPRASELLRSFRWPGNYTQFRQVLHSLAVLTEGNYIGARTVAELLAQEREFTQEYVSPAPLSTESRTLDQIIHDAITQSIQACNGNQTAAAERLGISRSTLWRHLNR